MMECPYSVGRAEDFVYFDFNKSFETVFLSPG